MTGRAQVIEFADFWTEGSCLLANSILRIERSRAAHGNFEVVVPLGRFMHIPWDVRICDHVQDDMFGPLRDNEWGGEYGPYQITRYAIGHRGRWTRIYFTMQGRDRQCGALDLGQAATSDDTTGFNWIRSSLNKFSECELAHTFRWIPETILSSVGGRAVHLGNRLSSCHGTVWHRKGGPHGNRAYRDHC